MVYIYICMYIHSSWTVRTRWVPPTLWGKPNTVTTHPICVAIRLPFVSQHFGENLGGCGHRDVPQCCCLHTAGCTSTFSLFEAFQGRTCKEMLAISYLVLQACISFWGVSDKSGAFLFFALLAYNCGFSWGWTAIAHIKGRTWSLVQSYHANRNNSISNSQGIMSTSGISN